MAKINPFRFSTKYTDNESRLYYYGCRFYSASTGSWLSRDKFEEIDSADLYSFVENNPINNYDYLGYVSRDDLLKQFQSRDSEGVDILTKWLFGDGSTWMVNNKRL